MKVQYLFMFLLAFVLVGQGCVGGTETADDAMMDDSDTAMEETMMEDDDMDDDMEDEDSMMEDEDGEEDEDSDDEMEMEADVEFEVSGKNFEFSETELTVNEGDVVRVIFTSESGFHDWVVDEFDAATAQVRDGETTEVTFVADEAGEFEFYCSVGQHREFGMVGTLIVE